ncbi:MAG: 3-hydroxyacyl-CoA dehydrogenase NAD-binding domain-containing protein, partial [Candidatus Dormibacteria bacterium]
MHESDETPHPPRLVGIVGAGTMGSGIALALASAGLAVRLFDADAAALERSRRRIDELLASQVTRGRIESGEAAARAARIAFVADAAALGEVELAI